MTVYKGSCMCGVVKVEVEGDPMAMAVCHCKLCRAWSASPVTGASLWAPDKVKITAGHDNIASYAHVEGHDRTWCANCGGHVFTDHSTTYQAIDVYAAILEDFEYKPTVHVNYESSVLPMKDGLPKFKDFPKEMGGSGDLLDEYNYSTN